MQTQTQTLTENYHYRESQSVSCDELINYRIIFFQSICPNSCSFFFSFSVFLISILLHLSFGCRCFNIVSSNRQTILIILSNLLINTVIFNASNYRFSVSLWVTKHFDTLLCFLLLNVSQIKRNEIYSVHCNVSHSHECKKMRLRAHHTNESTKERRQNSALLRILRSVVFSSFCLPAWIMCRMCAQLFVSLERT